MGVPKLTLRVELRGNCQVNIKLLHVTPTFIKEYREIFTPNQWELRRGREFSIHVHRGIITFPPQIDDSANQTLNFRNDKLREILLRDLSKTLVQWSGNRFFNRFDAFADTPSIRYHKKLWIIY